MQSISLTFSKLARKSSFKAPVLHCITVSLYLQTVNCISEGQSITIYQGRLPEPLKTCLSSSLPVPDIIQTETFFVNSSSWNFHHKPYSSWGCQNKNVISLKKSSDRRPFSNKYSCHIMEYTLWHICSYHDIVEHCCLGTQRSWLDQWSHNFSFLFSIFVSPGKEWANHLVKKYHWNHATKLSYSFMRVGYFSRVYK